MKVAHRFGFRSWGHYGHPCFSCCATGGDAGNLQDFDGASLLGLPWQSKTWELYDAACTATEHIFTIHTQADLQHLLGCLHYDKRSRGGRGRVLRIDAFTLKRGDRLEPSVVLPDVGLLDDKVVPAAGLQLTFWRVNDQTAVVHRNPMFGPLTMLSPQALAVDEMHCLHLGVFQVYILTVIWASIDANAWGVGDGLSDDALGAASALRIRHDLSLWYKAHL
jgi:hypothetical protein